MKHSYSYQYNFNNSSKVQVTEDSFKTFNWKPELRKKFFTKEQQSPEKLLFPDLRMKSGIQNLVRQKFQQILDTQMKIGFEAAYFITYHYSNPYERKPNEEFMTYKQQERQMKKDIETMKRRFDYDCTTENSTHIRNVLLKLLFGITRPDVYRGELPCMFFFHELGDLGFHTHLMIPRPTKTRSLDNTKELRRILNQPKFRKKVKTLSKKNPVDVQSVEESRGGQTGLYRYLTKQTREEYTSFDCMSSLAYNPLTEVVTAPRRKVSYVPATTLSSRRW